MCKILFHLRNICCKFRFLSHDRRGDISDSKAFFVDEFFYVCEQDKAVRVFILRVGIGEIMPDVKKSRGGKECVHDRVDEHVAVTVRKKSAFRRYLHAAEHDMIICFSESMGVNADARAKLCHTKVLSKGQFNVGSFTRKEAGWCDVFGEYTRIIGKDVLRCYLSVCRKQLREGKALRGLYKESAFTVEFTVDHAV